VSDPYRLNSLRDIAARRELERELHVANTRAAALPPCHPGAANGRATSRFTPPASPPAPPEISMPTESKKCTRPGCARPLRSDNVKGVCASGCLSGEAPPAVRAPGVNGRPPLPGGRKSTATISVTAPAITKPVVSSPPAKPRIIARADHNPSSETLRRFRLLADALGIDPDRELATFAQGYIDRATAAVKVTGPIEVPVHLKMTLDGPKAKKAEASAEPRRNVVVAQEPISTDELVGDDLVPCTECGRKAICTGECSKQTYPKGEED
jgi:hypothetical protein